MSGGRAGRSWHRARRYWRRCCPRDPTASESCTSSGFTGIRSLGERPGDPAALEEVHRHRARGCRRGVRQRLRGALQPVPLRLRRPNRRAGSVASLARGGVTRRRPGAYRAGTAQGQRSPRLKVTASKGRIWTGASSCAVAINTHFPSRSSNASTVRSAGSTSHRWPTPSRA